MHPELMRWAFQDAILDLVTPLLGPDLALFSIHFICKPKGNGRRVPWHEDSAYWGRRINPMEVCTLWLALDPSTRENGCMMVIPRTHLGERAGFSDYEPVDTERNVFPTEIVRPQRDVSKRVYIELQPNHCSLHDAKIQHASEPNTSNLRRCGWTMRFCPTSVRFNQELFDGCHQVYLARTARSESRPHGFDPLPSRWARGNRPRPCACPPALAFCRTGFAARQAQTAAR
jgi:ectoine hydroxylase-related dioxygenase (phytanoyl-CoA dioxygenase family)